MNNQLIELDDAIMTAALSKENIKNVATRIINSVESGMQPPLEVYARLKFAEQTIESCLDGVKPYAIDEITKYNKGEKVTSLGAEIKAKEVGAKYDYTVCNHADYNQLMVEYNAILEKKKAIEATLKTIKEPYTVVNEDTGETYKVYPPLKTSTSSIEVSIK